MRISELLGHRIGLLGFGAEGRATLAALRRAGHRDLVRVLSDRPETVPDGAELHVGVPDSAMFSQLDVVVRSPGFRPGHPARRAADAQAVAQTTATDLFLSELREAGLPVIGITGSKGKSTTSTLAHLALREAGIASMLVGNIGTPGLDALAAILRDRVVAVLELSSYQCADLRDGFGPGIAGLLDLFPEHLDWHGGVDAYYAAKLRLAETQRPGDAFRYNARSAAWLGRVRLPGNAVAINQPAGLHFAGGWFRRGAELLFADTEMRLRGLHNRENAVAALALVELAGAGPEHLRAVLASFGGLPFRLEDEGVHGGVRWINDSLSTAPEAVAAALEAGGPEVRTLIAGGHDRGYDPAPLAAAVGRSAVRTLILLPETEMAIARCVRARQVMVDVVEVAGLEEAVVVARDRTPAGTICLFSPGAPSYNRYRSFEERGRHFRDLLRAL